MGYRFRPYRQPLQQQTNFVTQITDIFCPKQSLTYKPQDQQLLVIANIAIVRLLEEFYLLPNDYDKFAVNLKHL